MAGSRIGAVVLAAGRGSRLGGVCKALLDAGGETFVARIARICGEVGIAPVAVVVGAPFAGDVSAAAAGLGLEVAVNPDPDRGMGSSVAVGFAHARDRWPGVAAALLWPVDHPWVAAETVAAVSQRASPGAIVIPVAGDRGGHPPAIGRALWPEMATCGEVEGGARAVFRHNREVVVRLPVSDANVTRDVDLPDDL